MKKEIKGFVYGVILTALLGCGVSAAGVWDNISVLKNDINVVVNGENVTADNFLYNDTTYLPLRAVSEALNQTVAYDESTNTAYIGERKDNDIMKSKYTPPEELKRYIRYNSGIYYILPDYIYELAEAKGYKTNIKDVIGNDNADLIIYSLPKTWSMVDLYDIGMKVIPYDTYVDEIEPLLK